MCPQLLSHQRERVGEGGMPLMVPGRLAPKGTRRLSHPLMCEQWISENSPSKAGVVRSIAKSDHWRCVSNPRCLRTSWKVTSNCQHITNQQTNFIRRKKRDVVLEGSVGRGSGRPS